MKHNAGLLNAGAISAAIGASICCFGPLLLAVMGLGGGALLLKFEPYRPYFLAVTAGLLGGAFYFTYRRAPAADCGSGTVCERAPSRRGQKVALWIVTVLVILIAAFPYYSEALF